MHSYEQSSLRIICRGFGGESGRFLVQVYDGGRVVFETITLSNQAVPISLSAPKEYRVRVRGISCIGSINPAAQTVWVKTVPCATVSREFLFYPTVKPFCKPLVDMRFRLTDRYYPNLPIEKGVLTICPSI